jgi:hypothetical protein
MLLERWPRPVTCCCASASSCFATAALPDTSTTQVLENDLSCLARTPRALQKHQLLQQQPCLQIRNKRVMIVARRPAKLLKTSTGALTLPTLPLDPLQLS